MDQEDRNAHPSPSGGRHFEIRVKGHLGSQWSDWLDGLEVTLLDSDETVLSGTIVDQAALMGILNKLNRLNLTLLSVNQTHRQGAEAMTNQEGPAMDNADIID
jgi:hypothetical protein